MKYTIIFWHRYDIFLTRKLKTFCDKEDENFVFTGSLDEFAEKHNAIFMVRPERKQICVTQHSGFQQR